VRPDNLKTSELPWIQMHLGELSVEVETSWLATLHSAWQMEVDLKGAIANRADARAKGASTKAVLEVTERIFEICGGSAAMRQYPAERYYRDARMQTLMAPGIDHVFRTIGLGLNEALANREPASASITP
jgi:alkylation response protein AidB-like acyl-CoA dehydrogenase